MSHQIKLFREHWQDPWHNLDRSTNNATVHCHGAGHLPGMFSCSYPLWSPNNQRVSSLGPDLAQPVKGQSCHFLSRSWGIFFPAGRNHGWDQISEVCRSDLRFMECKGSKLMSWGRKLQESCPSTWTKLSAHKATVAMAAIQEYGFELVQHQPRSPDLAPLDCQLIPYMKREHSGSHVDSNDDVVAAVDHFLKVLDVDFYKEGICMLHDSWT